MIKKNKKRIDPRFFINETVIREGDEISEDVKYSAESAMAQLNAATACENSSEVISAVKSLSGFMDYFEDDKEMQRLLFSEEGLRVLAQEMDRRRRVRKRKGTEGAEPWWSLQQQARIVFSKFEEKGLIDADSTLEKIDVLKTC